MAQMKLEDKMKERLEERTIEPSAAAWDRIAGKLETQDVVKKSNRKLWLAIAASFIGGVVATLIILNQEPFVQGNDQLVITPEVEGIEEMKNDISKINSNPVAHEEESNAKEAVAAENVKKEVQTNTLSRKQDEHIQNVAAVAVVKENEAMTEEVSRKESVSNNQGRLLETAVATRGEETEKTAIGFEKNPEIQKAIDTQLDALVASVDLQTVSDEEIDVLLKNAQREIISSRVFDANTGRVDASALLLDVEAEVDPQSFRDKVFEALADGFVKARDAIVDRNN